MPKVHKTGIPLRLIVSCIGSPSYKLSKHIVSRQTDLHVKNSKHFKELVEIVCIFDEEI